MHVLRVWAALAVIAGVVFGAGIASASEPYLDEDFESGSLDFNARAWGFSPVEGHVGAGVKVVIPQGAHWGGNAHFYFDQKGFDEPDELWWRYWVKFPADFVLGDRDGGKLPGPAGLYHYRCLGGRESTVEEPCWTARGSFARSIPEYGSPDYPQGPDGVTWIGTYAYHLDGAGESIRWSKPASVLANGRWYCVEGHVRLNTPGLADGVLEGWVDGAKALSRSDVAFRRAGEEWMHVQSFWFLGYYGGASTSPVRNEIHFDSLSLHDERIGCDDSTPQRERLRDLREATFPTEISWLLERGISLGCNPPDNNRFCPSDVVTRGQMAGFLTRALGLPTAPSPFSDTVGSPFEREIGGLALAGITDGCGSGQFCPDQPMSREQMAAFLVRAYSLYRPDADSFSDDDDSLFEGDIEALRYAGVTMGCGEGRFCPRDPVSRDQMAAFLYRLSH